jgi:hypothetical protein
LNSMGAYGNDSTRKGVDATKRPALMSSFEGPSLATQLVTQPRWDGTMGPSLLPTPAPTTGRSSR